MYNHIYQLTHDMDCFFVLNGIPTHFASNGCIVPSKLGTVAELREMQASAAKMNKRYGFVLNMAYLSGLEAEAFPSEEDVMAEQLEKTLNEELFIEAELQNIPFHWKLYSQSFAEMAAKGYWSFDRTGEDENGKDQFVLIAWPKHKKRIEGMPAGHQLVLDTFDGWCACEELCIWPLTEMIQAAELKKLG